MTRVTRRAIRCADRLIRKASAVAEAATMPWEAQNEGDAAGSLWALQRLTHLARQVLDLLEAGQRLLVELVGREEQQLNLGEDRRQVIGQVVPQLRQRLLIPPPIKATSGTGPAGDDPAGLAPTATNPAPCRRRRSPRWSAPPPFPPHRTLCGPATHRLRCGARRVGCLWVVRRNEWGADRGRPYRSQQPGCIGQVVQACRSRGWFETTL